VEPGHADAWADCAGQLLALGRTEEALEACRRALRVDPRNLPAMVNQGCALMQGGDMEGAEARLRQVLEADPLKPDARLALARCLHQKGELLRAAQEAAEAVRLAPGDVSAHQALGGILYALGRWDAFGAEIERYRRVQPGSAYLDFEQGFLDLLRGELLRGWKGHEARLRIPGLIGPRRHFTQPLWDGRAFPGRTLLLHYEQGLGDTLMFVRYAAMAKALGGRVVLEVQPALADLVGTCPGVDEVVAHGAPLPPFDLQAPLMSLPWIFRTELSSIPRQIPYLSVPERVGSRKLLADLIVLAKAQGRRRVGVVWAGNPSHRRDRERSLPAEALAPLGELPEVAWFSFQLGRPEVPPLPGLVSLAPLLGDFSDTACALSGMDLVITVDTALAHLAGAMGIPTLLLLPFTPDWRWMLDRADSPWYPSLRLYRQEQPGDWEPVIQRLVRDLPGYLSAAEGLSLSSRETAAGATEQDRKRLLEVEGRLEAEPGRAELWSDRAGLLFRMDRLPEAEEACHRALGLDPRDIGGLINLGILLMGQERLEEAETCFRKALELVPDRMDVRMALSECLFKRQDWGKAYENLLQVLEHDTAGNPASAEALHERGLLDLLFGNMPQGWEGHEARLRIPALKLDRGFTQPSWDGAPFPGSTLLLHCEQGFGDTIMLLRYLPRVKALGGRVLLVVQPALAGLAATCPGVDQVILQGEPLPSFDLFLPLFSLPRVFRTGLDTIPAEIPYLDVPASVPNRGELARVLAQSEGRVRIGLVWSGNAGYKNNAARSMPCGVLAPLAALGGVAWYSLNVGSMELPELPDIRPLSPFLSNFSDTAYALSGMDLVISVDTAVAHLAGALGVPTLLLLPFFPDWRWMLGRDDSPWYPTARLYRQPGPGEWEPVVRQLMADLSPDPA